MSLLSIHKETNKFNSCGDIKVEYVIKDHRGTAITALETRREANTAMLMLCGGPGDLAFYDYHAQVWYPKLKNRVR